MKTISKRIANWCRENYRMSDADCHIVAYGIESMLNSSLKILIILCVGALIGYFREVVIAMFVFGGIRKFAGGYHSSSHLGCLSVMLFICLCPIPLFGVEVRVAGWVWLAIAVYALYEVIRYAPRNSRVNPIYDQGILRRKRVGSLIVTGLAVVFLALYPGNELRWLVAMPLFIEALTISPLFYGKKDKTDGEAS